MFLFPVGHPVAIAMEHVVLGEDSENNNKRSRLLQVLG